MDLATSPDPTHDLEGTSYQPLIKSPQSLWKTAAFSASRRMTDSSSSNNPLMTTEGHDGQTIRTARYRYTEWTPLGREGEVLVELYDLQRDPIEYFNIKDDPANADLVAELSDRLATGWQGELPPSAGN